MLVFISKFISIDKPNCHFERAKRVEKSKSCKYNKYPELPSTKTALFMDSKLICPFLSTKTPNFMDRGGIATEKKSSIFVLKKDYRI